MPDAYIPGGGWVQDEGPVNNALVDSLESLGRWLMAEGYGFVTPTPATHQRVNARPGAAVARTLQDVFGWSRPFAVELLPLDVLGWLRGGDLLEIVGEKFRSRVRFSCIGERIYAHSAFPTSEPDAIFFGPDTYRFVELLTNELAIAPVGLKSRVLDMCCGAGPGGIESAFALSANEPAVTFADVNPAALSFAQANVRLAELKGAHFALGDLFHAVDGDFDLIIANPPYLVDPSNRLYRSGGGQLGAALSERIVLEGRSRLAPGGRLILYTGVAIIDGVDPFLKSMETILGDAGASFRYRELDPDVFGEELDTAAYAKAERIAAVALVVQRPSLAL